jgi:hypothetical protein
MRLPFKRPSCEQSPVPANFGALRPERRPESACHYSEDL